MVDSEITADMRATVMRVCRDYLGGIWSMIDDNEIVIIRIKGGLSNKMYKCSLPKDVALVKEEPRNVIVRMYGQIIHENPETVVTDSVLYAICAEKKIGPLLHGVFSNGRVEEFLEADALQTEQLHDPEIYTECAKIMARIHNLTMPLIKKPIWLFNNLSMFIEESLKVAPILKCKNDQKRRLQEILSKDLKEEYECLKNILKDINSPVLFCHNDMQEGNILYKSTPPQLNGRSWQLIPIDFEYASYNYRGFDMANYFCEWCYDYRNNDSYPYYSMNMNDFPTKEQQLQFIQTYLMEYDSNYVTDKDLEDKILQEILAFTLASDMLWALWSIIQAQKSTIKFGYLDYGLDRFDAYYSHKEEYSEKYRCIDKN